MTKKDSQPKKILAHLIDARVKLLSLYNPIYIPGAFPPGIDPPSAGMFVDALDEFIDAFKLSYTTQVSGQVKLYLSSNHQQGQTEENQPTKEPEGSDKDSSDTSPLT